MSDGYTPTTEDVEDYFALGMVEYSVGNGHTISAAHDAFRCWLAQYTAEVRAAALAEQGTEKPEWEYGYGSIADAEAEHPTMRRRKAGPWMPVEGEVDVEK